MIREKNKPFVAQGVSVLTKNSAALDPNFFGLDERTIPDLMNFILRFSGHIQYRNFDNKKDGNWSVFFEDDLAFLLAEIYNTELQEGETIFNNALESFYSSESDIRKKNYLDIRTECYRLYSLIDSWYRRSKKNIEHLNKNILDPHLNSAIRLKLSPHLRRIQAQDVALKVTGSLADTSPFESHDFDPIWTVSTLDPKLDGEKHLDSDGDEMMLVISNAYRDATGVITHLKHLSESLLTKVIEGYPYHEPHVSLVISFLKLFRYVQKDLNDITGRHLDYYYREILKQSKRKPSPDQAHVYFELAEHVTSTVIKSGTLLKSGVDEEGLDKTYALSQDLVVNQSNIDEIKVIQIANNPSIGIGNSYKDVSNIYASEIKIRDDGFVVNEANHVTRAYPFGRDQADISLANRDMRQAEVGFAISSSVLSMKEGDRSVSFTFKFSLKSLTSLVSFVEDIALHEKLSADNAFYKILNNVLRIKVTTNDGWYETDSYNIVRHNAWSDGEIRINMALEISEPAIIDYDKEIHGQGYDAQWPIFEFLISSKYAMYAYSYLKDLSIETCEIETDVSNVKDLSAFNDQGQLDIQMPFFPFGSNPKLGSYFILGHSEVFNRKVTDLSLDIQWHNLPRVNGGFETYYKEYGEQIKNDSFKIGLTGLSEFKFHPSDAGSIQQFDLFKANENDNRLSPKMKIERIDLEKLSLVPSFTQIDISEYSSKTRTGFLKFELIGPEMGFGFDLFPRLFSDAIVKNSTLSTGILGAKETVKVDLPNEAFAPQIRSISLNYKANSKLTFAADRVSDNKEKVNDQLYHIHPFGRHAIFEKGLPKSHKLLPQYDHEGYLHLGLSGLNPPATLSLLFQLEYNAVNVINYADIPKVEWSYMVNDDWIPFREGQILFDGTNNFTTSGIIKLKIPEQINTEHQILPSEKYWLRASAPKNTKVLSRIQFIKTNAAMVDWKRHKTDAEWEENISANTINGFIQTNPDINVAAQPFESFGGSPGETEMEFYNRVSERLRHKNRAIIPEDFERIILNRFSQLYQVFCLTSSRYPEFIKPGEVKIIIVPKINAKSEFILPRVDYNQLKLIEDEVKKLSTPFAKISIINPVYEKVRISCHVHFKSTVGSGEFVARLENDLRAFICPWYDTPQSEIIFGGSIERSALLTFIESLEYVTFVTRLSVVVLHYKNGDYSISDSAAEDGKLNVLQSSTPWSVLVPDADHDISVIDRLIHGEARETKIDSMKVGTDFVITEELEDEISYPYFDTEKDVFYSVEFDL
jgi:hypothetical protein